MNKTKRRITHRSAVKAVCFWSWGKQGLWFLFLLVGNLKIGPIMSLKCGYRLALSGRTVFKPGISIEKPRVWVCVCVCVCVCEFPLEHLRAMIRLRVVDRGKPGIPGSQSGLKHAVFWFNACPRNQKEISIYPPNKWFSWNLLSWETKRQSYQYVIRWEEVFLKTSFLENCL